MYVGSPAVEVGDTVGCGDSAAAAVVLGYAKICAARDKLFEASLRQDRVLAQLQARGDDGGDAALATATGAATAARKGAGRNVATAERVEALLGRVRLRRGNMRGLGDKRRGGETSQGAAG